MDILVANKTALLSTGIGLLAVYLSVKKLRNFLLCRQLKKAVRDQLARRQHQIQRLEHSLQLFDKTKFDKIARLTLLQLREALQSGEVSAVDALKTYQIKALEAQELCNCICLFVDEAEQWAAELDKGGDRHLPLFGIPISLKECSGLQDYPMTDGFAHVLLSSSTVIESDSVLVATIKELGAVPFCLTNIPQSVLSYCCSNPIYGTTSNPYDLSRSPGGSTGGEAALIACGGSLLGIGSDSGGSIRVPCHVTGTCGLKPGRRISNRGSDMDVAGWVGTKMSLGPMAADVDSLVLFMRHVLGPVHFSKDAYGVAPLPFNDSLFADRSKLRIGFYDFDGNEQPVPACKRAVSVARQALQQAGHTLLPIEVSWGVDAMCAINACMFSDQGHSLRHQFDHDLRDKHLDYLVAVLHRPPLMHRLLGYCCNLIGWKKLAKMHNSFPANQVQLRSAFAAIDDLKETVASLWDHHRLDAVICPVFGATPVSNLAMGHIWEAAASFSMLYNVVDYPAGVVPCTRISLEDDQALDHYVASEPPAKAMRKACKGAVGMPVGVQCVSRPFQEELCLRVMKELESLIDFRSAEMESSL